METLGNVLAAIVVFGSLWLVRLLTKREVDLLQRKNLDLTSRPLDDYEKDLDKIFDYSKIKTLPLFEAKDDFCEDDFRGDDTIEETK